MRNDASGYSVPQSAYQMIVLLVQIFMSAATLCYAAGFAVRHSNNDLHRKLMGLGFLLTLGIAVVLVAGVHLFDAKYGPALWLIDLAGGESNAGIVLIAHRIFATVTLLLLLTQVYSGLRRLSIHHQVYKALVPAWLITYLSGMFIFG